MTTEINAWPNGRGFYRPTDDFPYQQARIEAYLMEPRDEPLDLVTQTALIARGFILSDTDKDD
jgi:hypothetical protein